MRILCTGNPEFGVASAIAERWPETTFVNRTDWGYDLTQNGYKDKLAEMYYKSKKTEYNKDSKQANNLFKYN